MSKTSEIKISVTLDDQNIPVGISWDADDNPTGKPHPIEAVNLSFWDSQKKDMMKYDLWTRNMEANDMKMFTINMMGAMAQNIMNSTQDEFMSHEINETCNKLVAYLKREMKAPK